MALFVCAFFWVYLTLKQIVNNGFLYVFLIDSQNLASYNAYLQSEGIKATAGDTTVLNYHFSCFKILLSYVSLPLLSFS